MCLPDAEPAQAPSADAGVVHRLATESPGIGAAVASHGGSGARAGDEARSAKDGARAVSRTEGQAPPPTLDLPRNVRDHDAITNGGYLYQLAASTPTDDAGAALAVPANCLHAAPDAHVSRAFSNVSAGAAVRATPSDGSGSEAAFVFSRALHDAGAVSAPIYRTTSDV